MSITHITSRQNPRVKDAAKLRLRRQRERQGRFVIDGAREILRAMDAGVEIVEAYLCESLATGEEARRAADRLASTRTEISTTTVEVFEKLCFGERVDGVVAVAAARARRLDEIQLPPRPLIAVLEGVEKPGNLGAVLRSADGAGVDAVIIADGRTDLFNPSVIRASMGTLFSLQVGAATTDAALAWLEGRALPIFAARPDAAKLYTEVDYRGGAAIVLGSEADGLSSGWRSPSVTPINLPMRGAADSLNVSAAAAVLFYEARRQRQSHRDSD